MIRDQFIELIKKLGSVSYKVSSELPFSNIQLPMYIKNIKYIYVDNEMSTIETLIPVMNGVNIETDIKTIRIYLSNDAKQIPPDYAILCSQIMKLKDSITGNYYKRDAVLETKYEDDILVSQFEFKFYTIKE